MSLIRLGMRVAVVQALKGRTLVGDNVLDSEIGALETDASGNLRSGQTKPFVTVYTDRTDRRDGEGWPRAFLDNGMTDLVIEIGIAATMLDRHPDTGIGEVDVGEVVAGIPATDRAFEFHLDVVCRQIADALTDCDNPWASIFQGLSTKVHRIERARASSTEQSGRLAAAQLRVTLELIEDPSRGEAIDPATPFGRLLALMEDSNAVDLVAYAATIRSLLAGDYEPWRIAQERLGLSAGEVAVLGIGPLEDGAEIEGATIEIDGLGSVEVTGDA